MIMRKSTRAMYKVYTCTYATLLCDQIWAAQYEFYLGIPISSFSRISGIIFYTSVHHRAILTSNDDDDDDDDDDRMLKFSIHFY